MFISIYEYSCRPCYNFPLSSETDPSGDGNHCGKVRGLIMDTCSELFRQKGVSLDAFTHFFN